MAATTETTVKAVTPWLTRITEVEMQQTLRQQLEHPNEQYHLHLEATYTAQLQHNQEEGTEAGYDMTPATDPHMTAAGPNTAEPGIAIKDRAEPTTTAQQDYQADTPDDVVHQQWDPSQQQPTHRTSTGNTRNYCEEEIHHCPIRYEQPYGKREGVAISTSGLPGAGRGLFRIRPRKGNPFLFKQANEFVCVYATMQDVISATEAQATESAYVWTNSQNVHLDWDPAALYFDARDNQH